MSIISDIEGAVKNIITQVEQDVINSITNLLTKAQSSGSASAEDVKATCDEIQGHFNQAKQ